MTEAPPHWGQLHNHRRFRPPYPHHQVVLFLVVLLLMESLEISFERAETTSANRSRVHSEGMFTADK
jgi:hypothetical protein